MTAVFDILFDGIAVAMVLFLISIGLSITMGLMGIANLAHGALAMLGAYVAVTAASAWHLPFAVALAFAFIALVVVGAVVERLFFRQLYEAGEIEQVLLTIGLVFVAIAGATAVWGPLMLPMTLPALLHSHVELGPHRYPAYRLFLIVVGIILTLAIWFGLERTRMGAMIRAAVDDRRMAQTLGIDTGLLFTLTFAIGSGIAGLGGALSVEVLGLTPIYALEHLPLFLIVVAVGGLGSPRGTFLAAMVLGICDTAAKFLAPAVGGFAIYVLALVILLVRPQGLWSRA